MSPSAVEHLFIGWLGECVIRKRQLLHHCCLSVGYLIALRDISAMILMHLYEFERCVRTFVARPSAVEDSTSSLQFPLNQKRV